MNHQYNPEVNRKCAEAFLDQIALTIKACVNQSQSLSEAEQNKLTSSLVFAFAAHLSGSSYGGAIGDEEIYPVLGFSRGEVDDTVYFGGTSSLHEYVSSAVKGGA